MRSITRSTSSRAARKRRRLARPTTAAGCSSTFRNWPSRKPLSRRGASRKSSACEAGGVSTTIRSYRPLDVHLAELLHRRVLAAAGERVGQVAVDRVREDPLARGGIGAKRVDQLVEGALRVEHQRRQRASAGTPAARRRSRGTSRGSLPSGPMPSASASRRAGSIVITSTRLPARAAASAERRGDGRLADAARTDADQHAAARASGPASRAGSGTRAAQERARRRERERGDAVRAVARRARATAARRGADAELARRAACENAALHRERAAAGAARPRRRAIGSGERARARARPSSRATAVEHALRVRQLERAARRRSRSPDRARGRAPARASRSSSRLVHRQLLQQSATVSTQRARLASVSSA